MARKSNAPGIGHNSGAVQEALDGPELEKLLADVVPRIEALNEEKSNLNEDIKDLFTEAKARGANTKVLRKLLARRKAVKERGEREIEEMEELLELYTMKIEKL